ncbi:MAG: Uma2 family endonuclease [Drouetiella hepatica Uher 2000/2452]|jgi:Uma2 family endonuclease|uniref:Uma2 family endonuclease n=1 Tax=Drouetiella hepatica Uher 2000/2452 TaxID=904376 RepID=A0A951Q9R1_9CYAN|nr:Uma2 family endonuclease [Drouetiella hepatica Uher 2000/2452]
MVAQPQVPPEKVQPEKVQPAQETVYPDCDGNPMSDNTKQFRWIVTIQQNLEWLFAHDPNIFVAGDLLWYPVQGEPKIRTAPDVMVALGRPKGDRGSYKQWEENGITPQVVFEILSPGNTQTEMNKKLVFYDRYGVEEYYLYDPDDHDLSGWLQVDQKLDVIDPMHNWVSPRLGIRFEWSETELQIFRPDGKRFLSYVEIAEQAGQAELRADQAELRADQAELRADQAELRAEQLAERLRAAGIDPDTL